jgi:transposase, IS30 family
MARSSYQQLSYDERVRIALLLEAGLSLREISEELERSPSTISREVRRNFPPSKTGNHLAVNAHQLAQIRKISSRRYPRLRRPAVREYVCTRLMLGWSPEIISGRLAQDLPGESISHEAIYQFVYNERRDLAQFLVRACKQRRRRLYPKKRKAPPIPQRTMIDERPEEANQRATPGHWEVDTVLPSKDGQVSLVVAVDRFSRLVRIGKLSSRCSTALQRRLVRMLGRYPQRARKTITYDNGSENALHLSINQALGTSSYFCRPYHSWEKGTVENTIGVIRRFLPRQKSLDHVTTAILQKIENWLNHRPKKVLNFSSPHEIFSAVALSP